MQIYNNAGTASVVWDYQVEIDNTNQFDQAVLGTNKVDIGASKVSTLGSNNQIKAGTETSFVVGNQNFVGENTTNVTIFGQNHSVDDQAQNAQILGGAFNSISGSNQSTIMGSSGSTIVNSDSSISINGTNDTILQSDFTTAINSHENEVIVNGSGHAVIGLNLEGAGLDLLNTRNNSNWLGDTYLGEAILRERRQLECGDSVTFDLSDTQYKHDNLYILNWSGLSPGNTTIDLPNAVNSNYKNIVLQFQANGTFDGTTDVNFTPFGAQTINGTSTYTLSNAYDGVTFTTSGSGWLALAGGAGGSTEASYLSAYNSSSISPSANVSASVPLPNVEFSQNISIVSGSRITFDRAGVYDIQFSAQAVKSSGTNVTTLIWIKKNGVDVDWTNTEYIIAGNANDEIVLAWNWYVEAQSNDYYEIAYVADTSTLTWQAKTGVTGPDIPSWIVSVGSIGGGSTFISGSGGDPDALYTASFSNPNLNFIKGDGNNFDVNLSTLVPNTASFANTASFTPNALVTASISNATTTYTKGNGSTFALTVNNVQNAFTASFTPNALVTASVSSNTITFTKGNGTTFPITVNTGSFSAFPFTGSAVITGSLVVTGSERGNFRTLTISSQTASLDCNAANFFSLTLVSGSTTHVSASNVSIGQTIGLIVTQASAGGGTISFNDKFKQPAANIYTPTGAGIDVLTMISAPSASVPV
jgi:hypothetical protein